MQRSVRGIALLGGRVIDPFQGLDREAAVLIKSGRIEQITDKPIPAAPDGYEAIAIDGQIVSPGFIDVHTHLREPGEEHKETIATGTLAAARGGFTTVCAMPNTMPCQDNANVIAAVLTTAAAEGIVEVLAIGAVTVGRAGTQLADMAEMAEAGAIGFSDDGDPVADPNLMRQALSYASGLGLPIMNHPQEPSLTRGAQMNDGPIANRLGLVGWPGEAEAVMIARDVELAALTRGRLHECHVSTRRSIEILRAAKERGVNLTAEVTPHHLTLTDAWVLGERGADTGAVERYAYDTSTKVNPPLRSQDDVDAVISALADGTIDMIATDHAPHAVTDKACTYQEAANGIANLETALASVLSIYHAGAIDLPALLERMTAAPARFLGRETGTMKKGTRANVTVFDPDQSWTVDPAEMASLGKNTPLAGTSMRGRVNITIVNGEIVWRMNPEGTVA